MKTVNTVSTWHGWAPVNTIAFSLMTSEGEQRRDRISHLSISFSFNFFGQLFVLFNISN